MRGSRRAAADIIIGTQIVAKGHNFPLLTLVGVIDADLGLQGSDLRAAERTFQLMRQVSGRAGRTAERKGEAWLQTHQPEHPVIRAILGGDEEAFWRAEAAERRAAGVPPYGRMAGIILSSTDVAQVFDFGAELARRCEPLQADRGGGLGACAGADCEGAGAAPGAASGEGGEGRAVAGGAGGVAGGGEGAEGFAGGGGYRSAEFFVRGGASV